MTAPTPTDNINGITAANLRAAADLLERHPDLPTPYVTSSSLGGTVSLAWYLHHGDDQRANAAAIVKAIDGRWDRRGAEYEGPLAEWTQARDGLRLTVTVAREQVCERIVVGTEEVTVPAVEAKPERTEVREVVEWRCEPLLTRASWPRRRHADVAGGA
jgi:hypothetical protein